MRSAVSVNPAPRLAAFYAAYFGVIGVLMPFWPVWLAEAGATESEIGVLVATGAAVRLVGNPVIGGFVDRRGKSRGTLLVLAWAAMACFSLFAGARGFWWLLSISIGFGLAHSPLLALVEALSTRWVVARGLDYGRLRVWGSIAFIGGAVAAGALLERGGPRAVLVSALVLLAVQALATHALPEPPERGLPPAPRAVGALLRRPDMRWFLAATALVWGSHAVYYGFATRLWQRAGSSETVIGALWAEGVVCEIALFAVAPRIGRRFSAVQLMRLGAAAAALRWGCQASSGALWVAVATQPLHALSFGALHLGAMRYLAAAVVPQQAATAQGLYGACGTGAALGVGLALSGVLVEGWGRGAYWVMAAAAAVAVPLLVPLRTQRINAR